ncbi:MAG TPA: hypothetical protein VK879_06365 [Candidatus Sulfomarinibacteraceae bacterium]|nr:hypothetical protein [Candidatus Sulfomarinibacteraceae bacterium]
MSSRPRKLRLLGIVLIAVAVVLGVYTLVAYLGWQSGQSLRSEQIEERRAEELATQITRAEEDMAADNHRLAIRRLEWVLEQEPGHSQAAALLTEARATIAQTRAPSANNGSAEATVTPASTGATAGDGDDAAAERLRSIEKLVDNEEWRTALPALITFQNDHPDHERERTDRLLYEAYIGQGIELAYSDQIEVGLYYLEQAEKLGTLTEDARNHREWAELYLDGVGYYGVNWEVTLFYFRDLCLAAPFFHDSCDKLFEALVAYGDQYAVQQEWCPAEQLYAEAANINSTSTLSDKLSDARTRCAEATPTPTATVTGTITDTVPATPGPEDEP